MPHRKEKQDVSGLVARDITVNNPPPGVVYIRYSSSGKMYIRTHDDVEKELVGFGGISPNDDSIIVSGNYDVVEVSETWLRDKIQSGVLYGNEDTTMDTEYELDFSTFNAIALMIANSGTVTLTVADAPMAVFREFTLRLHAPMGATINYPSSFVFVGGIAPGTPPATDCLVIKGTKFTNTGTRFYCTVDQYPV